MRICAYVNDKYAKLNYKNECFDSRIFAGLRLVIDILQRSGYTVDYAGMATCHLYDIVLVSITSDCDWWEYIAERLLWQNGGYKVIIGGAGVLNVRPFLEYADYFVLGRAENIINNLVANIDGYDHPSVIDSRTFNIGNEYYINQVDKPYPHEIDLGKGKTYTESQIGCNHKCAFCSYSWQRKFTGDKFKYGDLWSKNKNVELAAFELLEADSYDLNSLRTTAIDGLSQRLRYAVNKRISREMIRELYIKLATIEKPHQVKLYNIVGYPTESEDDWNEFIEDVIIADKELHRQPKQLGILLHNTPFRAMPVTPLACAPMSKIEYRGMISKMYNSDKKYKGGIFYQGNAIWGVQSMGIESLPTVMLSAIIWRGSENDSDNIAKISTNAKFKRSCTAIKQATLEKYFDIDTLFWEYTPETLPTRYLHTYCKVEKTYATALKRFKSMEVNKCQTNNLNLKPCVTV